MNRRKNLTKIVSVALSALLLMSSMTVFASGTQSSLIYADIDPTYSISIPKSIELSVDENFDATGDYVVSVTGDLDALTSIYVVPDPTFNFVKSSDSTSVTASITQDKTKWIYTDLSNGTASVGNGSITASDVTAGSWSGNFYFNIDRAEKSVISVTAKDENDTNLNAEAYVIEGKEKDDLVSALITSGVVTDVSSVEDVDALIEVKSDDFDSIADTTFDVTDIAEEGDTVVILHYNEETGEWEYIGTDIVEDGKVSGDFTSYSPVAFIVVKEDGSTHVHDYEIVSTVTCTEAGSVSGTCECGESYETEMDALGHKYENNACVRCQAELVAGLYDEKSILLATWEETGIDIETDDDYGSSSISAHFVINNTYPKTSMVIIPEGVTTIGSYAFENCTNLKKVVIPSGVTCLSAGSFYGCTNLTEIVIPDSVTTLGMYAFNGCISLADITLPSNLDRILEDLFYNCKSLKSITIPSTVDSIGVNAFYGCDSLTSIVFEDTNNWYVGDSASTASENVDVTDPAANASALKIKVNDSTYQNTIYWIKLEPGLYDASSSLLATWDEVGINVEADYDYNIDDDGSTSFYNAIVYPNYPTAQIVVLPDGITRIGANLFASWSTGKSYSDSKDLTHVVIPDTVTEIGAAAFAYTNFENIKFPANLKRIEKNAFVHGQLTEVELPESLEEIGYMAFAYNDFSEITLPSNVVFTNLNDYASPPFLYCRELTSISVTENNKNYCSVDGVLFSKDKSRLIQYPCKKVGETYTIAENTTFIQHCAFYLASLTNITFENTENWHTVAYNPQLVTVTNSEQNAEGLCNNSGDFMNAITCISE